MESQNLADVKILSTKLGESATDAMGKYLEKILRHELGVLRDKDPEELHQMRVGMRRLRSAVIGFQLVIKLPQEAQEKNIGKIARILGNLRDLDVMLETLAHQYLCHLPPQEQALFTKFLSRLFKQRKSAFKEVKKILKHPSYQRLKISLTSWLENPRYEPIASLPTQEVLADLLFPQISQLFLHPGWLVGMENQADQWVSKTLDLHELDELLKAQGDSLHDLRKQAKKVRYLMSLFVEFYGEEYRHYLEDIKTIQEGLGNLQDSIVLGESITRLLKINLSVDLPHFSQLLAENRQKFWLQWQPIQARYLTIETRRNFHLAILSPLSAKSVHDSST